MSGPEFRETCISCAELAGTPDYHLLWDLLGRETGMTYLLHESENFEQSSRGTA
jgi:hypothetical protein